MTRKQKLDRSGELKDVMTDTQQDTRSSSAGLTPLAENPHTLVMSGSIPPLSPSFQATPNSKKISPNVTHSKIITAFAAQLGALVEWRKIELGDGRTGWALFFDEHKWLVDPFTNELTPLGES